MKFPKIILTGLVATSTLLLASCTAMTPHDIENQLAEQLPAAVNKSGAEYVESAIAYSPSGIPPGQTLSVSIHLTETPANEILVDALDNSLRAIAKAVNDNELHPSVRLYMVEGPAHNPGVIDANEQNRIDFTSIEDAENQPAYNLEDPTTITLTYEELMSYS